MLEKERKIMKRFSDKVFVSVDCVSGINEEASYFIDMETNKKEGKYNIISQGLSYIGNKTDFPRIRLPYAKPTLELSLDKNIVKYILDSLDYAEDSGKGELGLNNKYSYVYLQCKSNLLTIYATDSYRCIVKKDIPFKSEGFTIGLNAKCLKNIKEDISKQDEVSVVLRSDNLIGVEYGNKKMYHKYNSAVIDKKIYKNIGRWLGIFNNAEHLGIPLEGVDTKTINSLYTKYKVKKREQKIRFSYLPKYKKIVVTSDKKSKITADYLYKFILDCDLGSDSFSIVLDYSYLKKVVSVSLDKLMYIKANDIGKINSNMQVVFKTKRGNVVFIALCRE